MTRNNVWCKHRILINKHSAYVKQNTAGYIQLGSHVVPQPLPGDVCFLFLFFVSLPRRMSLEVRACSKLSLLSEATRAFSSSALDTYCLTCGKAAYIDLT